MVWNLRNFNDIIYDNPSPSRIDIGPSDYSSKNVQEMVAEAMAKAAGTGYQVRNSGRSNWKRPINSELMDKVVGPLWEWSERPGSPSYSDVGDYRAPNEQITTVDQSPNPTIQDMVEQILSGPRITTIPRLPMGPRITDVGSFRSPTTQITIRPRDLPQPGIDRPMSIQEVLDTIEAESNRQAANEFR